MTSPVDPGMWCDAPYGEFTRPYKDCRCKWCTLASRDQLQKAKDRVAELEALQSRVYDWLDKHDSYPFVEGTPRAVTQAAWDELLQASTLPSEPATLADEERNKRDRERARALLFKVNGVAPVNSIRQVMDLMKEIRREATAELDQYLQLGEFAQQQAWLRAIALIREKGMNPEEMLALASKQLEKP